MTPHLNFGLGVTSNIFRPFQSKQATREQESRNRDQLLQMRFTTNAAAASNGLGGDSSGGAVGSDTSILIDRALEHNSALNVRLFYHHFYLVRSSIRGNLVSTAKL